jgi:hypothetical protein
VPDPDLLPAAGEHEEFCQAIAMPMIEQIGKGVPVEHCKKCVQGLAEYGLELADRYDRARVRCLIETLHDPEICFGDSHDISQLDLICRARQRDATGTAGENVDIAVVIERLNNPHEMVF